MGYIGGKASAGVFHKIIGEMPPHSFYVEPFFGGGAVFKNKARATSTIVIDRAQASLAGIDAAAGVRAICGDALEILPTLNLPPDALVYADPPYLLSTRKNRRYYEFEMEDADHVRLLEILKALPCRVMISGYWSELYGSSLQNWRCLNFKARTRGSTVTEWLWMNFAPVSELHDPRYTGSGFRERLALKRQAARHLARLQAMPEKKRNFILGEIAAAHAKIDAPRGAPEMTFADPRADVGRSCFSVTSHAVSWHLPFSTLFPA